MGWGAAPSEPTYREIVQSQLMQQQNAMPMSQAQFYESPQIRPEAKFIEQLDPESINRTIEMHLRGKYYDSEKDEWFDVEGMQKINEVGLAVVMRKCRSIINLNTVYGNIPDDILTRMVISFGETLSRDLSLNYEKYGLLVLDINSITHFCTDMAYIALSRGKDALTLRLLRTMIESRELTTQMSKPEQKSSLWNPSTWGKR